MTTSSITNTISSATGAALSGVPVKITLMPGSGFRTSDASEVSRVYSTTTNSSGVWTAALERTADISPSGTYYQVEEMIPGAYRKYNIQVGPTSQTLFAALISTPPAVPVAQYLTQETGDARYVLSPGSFGGAPSIQPILHGDTSSAGVVSAYARIDHRHAFTQDYPYTVCTSTTRPASPDKGDTIYETDTGRLLVYYGATTGWQKPWGDAWGEQGYAQIVANTATANTTVVDITSLTTTFTTVANRKLRVEVFCPSVFVNTANVEEYLYITDGSNNILQTAVTFNTTVVKGMPSLAAVLRTTSSAGSNTFKARMNTSSGTIQILCSANKPGFILAEDMGPSGNPPSA